MASFAVAPCRCGVFGKSKRLGGASFILFSFKQKMLRRVGHFLFSPANHRICLFITFVTEH
jgi:hypothetical protein